MFRGMDSNADTNRAVVVARVAWLATFVVPLVLAGLLLAVKTAHAAPLGPAVVPFAFEEEPELEEGESGEEACEAAEEEFEEGELGEAEEAEGICEEAEDQARKKAAGPGVAPEECVVRSAHARVVAYASQNKVRLTVGYTTYEPTAAALDYSLTGGKGSLHLGSAKRHLGRSGVLRLTQSLSDAQMSKVEAAGHFTVRLHSTEAPNSCRNFETEQLTVEHASKRLAVWSQTE